MSSNRQDSNPEVAVCTWHTHTTEISVWRREQSKPSSFVKVCCIELDMGRVYPRVRSGRVTRFVVFNGSSRVGSSVKNVQ